MQRKGCSHHPPQLWVGRGTDAGHADRALEADKFRPVFLEGEFPSTKPRGGLWTSTYHEQHGGGWVQWCLSEEFGCDRDNPVWTNCWRLEPEPDARIYTIDSYADLERLCLLYGRCDRSLRYHTTYPDWTLVAEAYDAVHLTDEGQWATRLTMPYDLYGWDCESTLWFRWAFTKVEHLGELRFTAADPWWEESVA